MIGATLFIAGDHPDGRNRGGPVFLIFRKASLSVPSQIVPMVPGAVFPFFTEVDPELSRDLAGRDPLGLLPVWSAIGRELVPNLASPVQHADGIRAVLLIHWIGERPRFQALLTSPTLQRGFIRLMEGVLEYWLKQSGRVVCYGSQALLSGGTAFAVSSDSGKTVANGLHQYYRGSCERAGLVDEDWIVDGTLGRLFERTWNERATDALAKALEPRLESGQLLVDKVVSDTLINTALETVFEDQPIREYLRCILGEEKYRALARTFAELRHQDIPFHEQAKLLTSRALASQIDDMHRCEPFLLVLQDTFDILRSSSNEGVSAVADRIKSSLPQMRRRAVAFTALAGKINKAGPAKRMRELQSLAMLLVDQPRANDRATVVNFIEALVRYHRDCMEERGRDPLIALEGQLVAVHGDDERNPDFSLGRLASDEPSWDNDYYLNVASTIYKQLHGKRF